MEKFRMVLCAGLTIAAMCTAASAQTWGTGGISYTNSTGGTVYELDAPTSWGILGTGGQWHVLTGGGPDGRDSWWYVPGSNGSAQANWDFTGVPLPNIGGNVGMPGYGLYWFQAYVSDYGGQPHDGDAIFTSNGPPGNHAWAVVPQPTPGWTSPIGGNYNGLLWLSNDGLAGNMTISFNSSAWGDGVAVSGVRISTDGNFVLAPEPASAVLLLLGLPLLRRRGG